MGKRRDKRAKPKKRQAPARELVSFRAKERLIYRYYDGRRDVARDPLDLLRRLATYEGLALDVDAKLAMGRSPDAPKALGRLVGAVRDVFGVESFSEGAAGAEGLTDAECLALLNHFAEWLAEVQRDAAPFATSPQSTGPPPSAPSTTEPPSGCTSTSPGP